MGNMSYCRHENTYQDLADVWFDWVDDPEELSQYERDAREKLIELIFEMADDLEYLR